MSVCCGKCGKKLVPHDDTHDCVEELKKQLVVIEKHLSEVTKETRAFLEKVQAAYKRTEQCSTHFGAPADSETIRTEIWLALIELIDRLPEFEEVEGVDPEPLI